MCKSYLLILIYDDLIMVEHKRNGIVMWNTHTGQVNVRNIWQDNPKLFTEHLQPRNLFWLNPANRQILIKLSIIEQALEMHIIHNERQCDFTVSAAACKILRRKTSSHVIALALICEFLAIATTVIVIKKSFQLVAQLKFICPGKVGR